MGTPTSLSLLAITSHMINPSIKEAFIGEHVTPSKDISSSSVLISCVKSAKWKAFFRLCYKMESRTSSSNYTSYYTNECQSELLVFISAACLLVGTFGTAEIWKVTCRWSYLADLRVSNLWFSSSEGTVS